MIYVLCRANVKKGAAIVIINMRVQLSKKIMNELVFKGLKLNLDIKVCTIGEVEINLTKNEFNLLEFLIKNKNKIHSRQEILNNVWSSKVSLRTVDTTMSRLRKKMKDLGKYLVTRLGFGYGILE